MFSLEQRRWGRFRVPVGSFEDSRILHVQTFPVAAPVSSATPARIASAARQDQPAHHIIILDVFAGVHRSVTSSRRA